MAQTQETSTATAGASTLGSGAFGASGFEAIFPLAKEMWGVQLKTAQMLLDTTTKISHTFAEYYQTQAAEGLKLTQNCVATGLATGKTVAEEMRRQVTTLAERTTR